MVRTGQGMIVVVTLLSALPALAQSVPGLRLLRESPVCLVPARDCSAFWITEFGYFRRFTDSSTAEQRNIAFNLEGGAMVNWGVVALGAGVFYAVHGDGRRWGVKPRVRFWAADRLAFDVMPGVITGGWDLRTASVYPGWSAHIGAEWHGQLGVVGGVEVVPRSTGGSTVDWQMGGKISGPYGLATGITVGLMVAFIDALFGSIFGRPPIPTS